MLNVVLKGSLLRYQISTENILLSPFMLPLVLKVSSLRVQAEQISCEDIIALARQQDGQVLEGKLAVNLQ